MRQSADNQRTISGTSSPTPTSLVNMGGVLSPWQPSYPCLSFLCIFHAIGINCTQLLSLWYVLVGWDGTIGFNCTYMYVPVAVLVRVYRMEMVLHTCRVDVHTYMYMYMYMYGGS